MKTESMIDTLVGELKPAKKFASVYIFAPAFFFTGFLVSFLPLLVLPSRREMSVLQSTDLYRFNELGWFFIAALAAVAVWYLRFPDLGDSRRTRTLAALILSFAVMGILLLAVSGSESFLAFETAVGGKGCTIDLILNSLPASILAYWLLSRGAAPNRIMAGAIAGVFGISFSAALFPLVCASESAQHLAISHGLLPLSTFLLFAGLGAKRLLRW